MNVLLIQPPDSGEQPAPRDMFGGRLPTTSPEWDLICLHAYVLGHTRHFCELFDTRLFADVERDVNLAIDHAPSPKLVVVYCREDNLPETKSVLAALRREHPQLAIALCGPFPSAFDNR